jgi:hypothetical protein
MTVLNRHIVPPSDKDDASLFFADVLGLEHPATFGSFALLKVSEATALVFAHADGDITPNHSCGLALRFRVDVGVSRDRLHQRL